MTQRIYIGSDRVTVSKPGYDAVNPPAVDYKYLALDSRLNSGRPLEIGLIASVSVGLTVYFTTTYAGIPGVDLVLYRTGSNSLGNYTAYTSGVVLRDQGSVIWNRNPFYLGVSPDKFLIADDTQYVRWSGLTAGLRGYYILWQNW